MKNPLAVLSLRHKFLSVGIEGLADRSSCAKIGKKDRGGKAVKKTHHICAVLLLVPAVLTILAMLFLPDQVPVHYGSRGQIDRMGSKYELLLIAAFALGTCGFVEAILFSEEKNGRSPKRTYFWSEILVALIFGCIELFSVGGAVLYALGQELPTLSREQVRWILPVLCWGIALLLFCYGVRGFFAGKPLGIYSCVEAPRAEQVRDIKKYNRATGILIICYSLPMAGCGFAAIDSVTKGAICLMLCAILGGVVVMAVYECMIAAKYVRRKGKKE